MAAHRQDPPPPLPDRYEIVEQFGTGGMAVVYRAYDRAVGRDVAIKVLRSATPALARRMIHEARSDVWSLDVMLYEFLAGRSPIRVARDRR